MISIYEITIRLALASLLGSMIGLERQRRDWAAGLRTHMLVCVGATLAMIVSAYGFADVVNKPGITLDPSRIASQVISGIGFLGAGTILFMKNEMVRGLTTAAGLWTVAAIGLAVGGGLYLPSFIATVIVLIILAVIKPIEQRIFNRNKFNGINLVVKRNQINMQSIQDVLDKHELTILIQRLSANSKNSLTVLEGLQKLDAVTEVEFISL
jgi:putative Mg2+ transporter-C (MgtC) family protein